jgi:C4-dicarboxylate-specific signal transduction histidine kinase
MLPDLTGALQEIEAAADAIADVGAAPEQLARIRQNVARAQALARKGRNSTAWPHPLVRTDLATVLRSAEQAILAHPDAAGVVIDWDLASGLGVEANSLELQLVVISLAHNAFEAMRGAPARQLRISSAAWGALAIISIVDNGPGASNDLHQALYRLESHGDASGVGSGLYLSRRLVAAHRGRLWAEQSPSGGAIFKFTLPLAP